MKKVMLFVSAMLLLATAIVSCEDPEKPNVPDNKDGGVPTLTIAADAAFNAEMKATVTLTLSAAATQDVEVKLAKGTVQSDKSEIAADFTKKVVIPVGETTKTVEVSADAMGLESGEYQAAIKVESAEGAKVADNAVVYINYTFVFTPAVNLHADTNFASDKTAKLTVSLAKATSKDVKVKLATDAASTATVTYDSEVVVPAGETSKEITVTVDIPENLAAGSYAAIIKIESAENGEVGTSASVTINLVYPFSVGITVDGVFDDWNDPSIVTWTLPDGAIFDQIKCMKLAADSKFVYMYVELVEVNNDAGDYTPSDIYINSDGDNSTGCIIASIDNNNGDPYVNIQQWTNPGIEYYLEGTINSADGYADLTGLQWYLRYNGPAGASFWSGFDNLNESFLGHPEKMFAQGAIEGEEGKLEILFSRTAFGMTGEKAAFGMKVMDGFNGWRALGLAPQVASPNAPTYTAADELLYITLPPYAE